MRQIILILLSSMLFAGGLLADSRVTSGSKAAGLDKCVAPTADMRRNHMEYLEHDRDETVLKGVRETRYSLAGCIDCHAEQDDQGNYKPVTGEGQFCASCHRFVAVKLACFQCHSNTPETDAGTDRAATLLDSLEQGKRLGIASLQHDRLQGK